MDVDPCTGEVTDRILATMGLRGGRNAQNKFEYREDILSGYTREYRVVAEINGVEKVVRTKNGLEAGTYVQPVNVWVHGEQDVPGVPPIALDFSQLAFLTQGVGEDADGNVWGPLNPFPQSGLFINPPACDVAVTSNNATARAIRGPDLEPRLEKRGRMGRWHSRARTQAVADAENEGTTDPTLMEIEPQPPREDLTRP
jgi:hypothetical protein